jgi:N,N'-diacetylchitobiose transport system permease protein
VRLSRGKRIGFSVLAVIVGLVFLFPVYWMASSAVKPNIDVVSTNFDLFPTSFTFQHFVDAVRAPNFLTFLRNSLFVSLTAVLCSLVFGVLMAVPLARFRFKGRRGFLMLLLIAQLTPFEAMLIPMYLMMRDLNLLNQLPSLILVYFAATLPFTAWTLRGFVHGIPVDLEEAAMVDGCGRWQAFRRVTLPLLGPGLVATAVYGFITAWNEFLYALVFMEDTDKFTLPVWLSTFQSVFGTDWGGTMAASTLFTVPVVVFFLVVQRNLVAGVTAGAVKG